MFCRILEHHNNFRKESQDKFKADLGSSGYVAGKGGAGEPPFKRYKIGGPMMNVSQPDEEKRMISANTVTFPKGPPKGSAGTALADMGTESHRRAARMAEWEKNTDWRNSGTASGSSSKAPPPRKNQGKNQGNTGEVSKANGQNAKNLNAIIILKLIFVEKYKTFLLLKVDNAGTRKKRILNLPACAMKRKDTDRLKNLYCGNHGRRLPKI